MLNKIIKTKGAVVISQEKKKEEEENESHCAETSSKHTNRPTDFLTTTQI